MLLVALLIWLAYVVVMVALATWLGWKDRLWCLVPILALVLVPGEARADDDPNPGLWLAKRLPSHKRCKQALEELDRWLDWCRDYHQAMKDWPLEYDGLMDRRWTWERAAWATNPDAE